MTRTIAGIGALIVAKLEALVDGEGNRIIPEIFAYPKTEKVKYPSAEVTPTGSIRSERIEMGPGRNERVITYQIKLYQESTLQGLAEGATARIEAAIDAILTDFDTDDDLNDEVMSIEAERVEIDYTARTPKAVATFDIRCAIIIL